MPAQARAPMIPPVIMFVSWIASFRSSNTATNAIAPGITIIEKMKNKKENKKEKEDKEEKEKEKKKKNVTNYVVVKST